MITRKSLINGEWIGRDHNYNSVAASNGEETKQSYASMDKDDQEQAADLLPDGMNDDADLGVRLITS